ncbi:glutamate-cysteine ligase family protein [Parapusillimonas granuli]
MAASFVYRPRLGLEMEMVVADAGSGASLPVRDYFDALAEAKRRRGVACEPYYLGGRCVGLSTPPADCGLDNGFNLLETALAPVEGGPGGLQRLADAAHAELADTLDALRADGACVLSASQHPTCGRDAEWYGRVCVPRPIYRELREYRGWHHWEGIDAKAQNGANTSVPVRDAIRALNVAVALAPAGIALFANSPIESGRAAGYKENRMRLWPRVFAPARFPGDLRLCRYPARPFRDLADFFHWMFGPGTVTRGLPLEPSDDYKSVPTALPEGDPCLLDFLRAERWPARRMDTGRPEELVPHAGHFEYSQIGQFLDARLRYKLHAPPSLDEIMRAWERDGGLEELFERCGADPYIEARGPGAAFADADLLEEAGDEAARSVLVAPSALQAGLLANLDEACRLLRDYTWEGLGALREPAMRLGLAHEGVRTLCAEVLALARDGLDAADRHWLAYPEFMLATGRSAADRLLDTWNAAAGAPEARMRAVLARHAALHPDALRGADPRKSRVSET